MKRLNGSVYSLMAVLLFVLILLVHARTMEYMASKILPMLIGVAVILLTLIALYQELFTKTEVGGARRSNSQMVSQGVQRADQNGGHSGYLPISLWVIGYFAGVFFLGFHAATPLFVGAYMKQHGSSWRQTIVTTVVFAIIFFTVFIFVLKVDLYPGRLMIFLGR